MLPTGREKSHCHPFPNVKSTSTAEAEEKSRYNRSPFLVQYNHQAIQEYGVRRPTEKHVAYSSKKNTLELGLMHRGRTGQGGRRYSSVAGQRGRGAGIRLGETSVHGKRDPTTSKRRRALLVRYPTDLVEERATGGPVDRWSHGTRRPGTNKEQDINIVTRRMVPSFMW